MDTKQIITELKQESGLSLAQISSKSGISPTTMDNWIYRGYAPSVPKFAKFLNALGYELRINKVASDGHNNN